MHTLTDDATIKPQTLVAAASSPNRLVYKRAGRADPGDLPGPGTDLPLTR